MVSTAPTRNVCLFETNKSSAYTWFQLLSASIFWKNPNNWGTKGYNNGEKFDWKDCKGFQGPMRTDEIKPILIGKYKHAAYKTCYWTGQSLRTGGRRQCYKHNFGIKSHQCIQSTSFRGCNIACSFCWRDVEGRQYSFPKLDEPSEIAEQLISTQSHIIEKSLPDSLENYETMICVVQILSRGLV